MEINELNEVWGVVPVENIKEGRFVLLTTQGFSNVFGGGTDLPGCKTPDNTTEAKRARYMIGFAMDNRDVPIYVSIPQVTWSLRRGFDQAANIPFTADVYMTQMSVKTGLTIPSGSYALRFGEGRYTLPSGDYIYSSELHTPGVGLAVQDATTDATAGEAGKLKYAAFDADVVVALVEEFDSDNNLTFRII
jgi:hypothetical protein